MLKHRAAAPAARAICRPRSNRVDSATDELPRPSKSMSGAGCRSRNKETSHTPEGPELIMLTDRRSPSQKGTP